MAGAIDRILSRSLSLVNNNGLFSARGSDKLAGRLDKVEDKLDREEEKILKRLAQLGVNKEDLKKDKDKDKKVKDKKDSQYSAIEERLYEDLAKIEEDRTTLETIREKMQPDQAGSTDSSDDAANVDIGNNDDDVSIDPVENPIVISDSAQALLKSNVLGHSQLKLRELEKTADRAASDGQYLERSEELLDKQIDAAEDVQNELRNGTDPERLRKKQEKLFGLMEEKYLLDEALRNKKGQGSEEFKVEEDVFHTVPGNIEFIKEKEEEKRHVIDVQEQVKTQERSIFKEIDETRSEISRISKLLVSNLQQAEDTAHTLENDIPQKPEEAENAHYGLDSDSGKFLIE